MINRERNHHETARDGRHRDVLAQQLSAEILREAHDPATLEMVLHRVLTRPEVRHDTQLESIVRSFGVQCRAEIDGRMARMRKEDALSDAASHPLIAFTQKFIPPPPVAPLSEHQLAVRGFDRLRRLFDEKLLSFDLEASKRLLAQLIEFQTTHPTDISTAAVERCRHDLTRATDRRAQFAAEVEEAAAAAVRAARSGRADEAAKALKRLSSIRASRPELLSEERIEKIRESIEGASEHFEHREANRELVLRERAVSTELQKLAAIVHQFHALSHEIPIGDPRYVEAERAYLAAVREVRHHDQEWLADLMVELDELVSEVHDNTGKAAEQVNRFLHTVKTSIAQIVKEIREIAAEHKAASA